MNLKNMNEINRRQIERAGARYTPNINADAPNLEIEHVLQAFDALAYSDAFRDRVIEIAQELRTQWDKAPEEVHNGFERRKQTPEYVAQLLESVAKRVPGDDRQELYQLTRATRYSDEKLAEVEKSVREELHETEEDDRRQTLNNKLVRSRRLRAALGAASSFAEGPERDLLADRMLFLEGKWGTGKTHFLCDLTERRMSESRPTLLLLAESLPQDVPPLDGICNAIGFETDPEELLKGMETMGEAIGERALLLIDGINEADREMWRQELFPLAEHVSRYPNVGVAVSCRTPFDRQVVTKKADNILVRVEHYGFDEQEVDAQVEFFDFYDIPAPHVPLLTPEFSNPLFLKILCKAVARSEMSDRGEYLENIASGQKGMTDVLERFAKEVGSEIESDFGLERNRCWRILKGTSTGITSRSGIAGAMAEASQDYIIREKAVAVISGQTDGSKEQSEAILDRMITDGLLTESLRWRREETEVVRFPYQRFGDHIIARHLLAEGLNTDSPEAIRRSLYVDRPLGRLFELEGGGTRFKHPGLATAVMLEFPERIKRAVPEDEREVIWYLPKKRRRAGPIKEAFLEGLHWRNAESFGEDTDRLVGLFLDSRNVWTREETFEVLVGLASRPGHPYGAPRLYEYLKDASMPVRDRLWSEYLRKCDETSSVLRLLEWVERAEWDRQSSSTASNTLRLLSTFLTTSHRPLRDRVTRGIYVIGGAHPGEVFELACETFEFNDPYVPERLLASSYGVAMSLWADPDGAEVRERLPEFGRALIDDMFSPGGRFGTKHMLMRQYAQGIVELAKRVAGPRITSEQFNRTRDPIDQIECPFDDPEDITDEDVGDVERAFHPDFRNYTVGRLVPGRSSYDFEHEEYAAILRQIQGRVKDLGYSYEYFKDIDDIIGRRQWSRAGNGGKIDRYGKKYSWIAYFEMYGCRVDKGKLPDWEEEVHPADADVDPSFPESPPEWSPGLPEVFVGEYIGAVNWVRKGPDPNYRDLIVRESVDGKDGPWALLNGYIDEKANDPRRVFTFLRGLLVEAGRAAEVDRYLDKTDDLGRTRLPEVFDDHYTYAGEIPWSCRYGPYLRSEDGSAERNVQALGRPGAESECDSIPVEVPVHSYAWEEHHSEMNQVSGVLFPAPAVCERLELVNHNGTFDLFDPHGNRASVYRTFEAGDVFFDSELVYIRVDLLKRYLAETGQELVWITWGERQLESEERQAKRERIAGAWKRNDHVHHRFFRTDDIIADLDLE